MFNHKKFNFDYLDFHCREVAERIVLTAFDNVRLPGDRAGDKVVDEFEYERACFAEERRVWDVPYKIPVEERQIILDCVKNEIFDGCFYCSGKRFERFETLEVLWDAKFLGEKITLRQLGRGVVANDGTVLRPAVEVGETDDLIERLYKRIKESCDEKLNWYFTRVVGGDPA